MLQALDGTTVRRWAELGLAALADDRDAIDDINVYPVADNDTGTNLWQTMRSAVDRLEADGVADLDRVTAALARGALHGACGNSGMLLSQALRGVAEQARGTRVMDGSGFSAALERAARLASSALAEPAEGTLLTVLRSAAHGARQPGPELPEVVHAATAAAERALRRTPAQLPVLEAAGVVDAGGRGLVLLLDVLHAVVCDGRRLAPTPPSPTGLSEAIGSGVGHDSAYDYEVMYLLAGADEAAAAKLRGELTGLGDCVSVVADGTDSEHTEDGAVAGPRRSSREDVTWAVHVHCDDIGSAIEAGIESGRVRRIRVTRFADQSATVHPAVRDAGPVAQGAEPRAPQARHAVLACAKGAELGDLFRSEGAQVFTVEDARAPGADDLVTAILGSGFETVLLLPNDETLTPLAEQAAGSAMREGLEAIVVPTSSPVQGLAALAVHDPQRRTADDTVALAEAAAATRRGELVVADGEALTWVGYCERGDVLGMLDGEVVLIDRETTPAACELADRMLSAGGELVTVLIGSRAPETLAATLREHLRRSHPEVELTCYPAGELVEELVLGVE